jgi:excisionase family DNA binding protein
MSTDITRFMALADVADVLNISISQVYALVRRGELRAIKVGGKGQWRVENAELERYIEGAYQAADEFIREHPFPELADADARETGESSPY